MYNSLSDKSSSSNQSNDFDWIEASIKDIAEEIEYAPSQVRPMVSIPKQHSEEEKCLKLSFREMKQEKSEASEKSADTQDTNNQTPTAASQESALFNECNFRTRTGGMKPY